MKSNEKKRILVLNFEFPPIGGGGAYVTKEISERLSEENFVDVVTSGFGRFKKEESFGNLNIHRVGVFRKNKSHSRISEHVVYLIKGFLKVRELINKNKYDVCHCHFALPTGILALVIKKFFGIQYILTVHGSDVPKYNEYKYKFMHKFTSPLIKTIVRNSVYTVASTKYLAKLLQDSIGKNQEVKVIKQGFDSSKFTPKNKTKSVLLSGRLVKQKQIDFVFKQLSSLRGYEIRCVGDGPERRSLEELAKNLSLNVKFYGWLENDSDEYKELIESSQIYINLSANENFSVGIQEAMSAGCLIVTTKTGGNFELLGDSALYIEDADNISGVLNSGLNFKEKQKLVRDRILKLSWDKTLSEYKSLLFE